MHPFWALIGGAQRKFPVELTSTKLKTSAPGPGGTDEQQDDSCAEGTAGLSPEPPWLADVMLNDGRKEATA